MISRELKVRITYHLIELLCDHPHHPVDVAKLLEQLSEMAWLEAFEFYPPSVRIE